MISQLVRQDIDGPLLQMQGPNGPAYVKQLSAAAAWYAYSPEILENLADGLVTAVETRAAEAALWIHYHPQVQPLTRGDLQKRLCIDGRLIPWRVMRLGLDLCQSLEALHLEQLPQLVVHPERVAIWGSRFVLLPTLSKALPPLANPPPTASLDWVWCLAPEVLRTRGVVEESLYAADVYALGRLLQSLCQENFSLPELDVWTLMERRVESLADDASEVSVREFAGAQALWRKMTDRNPTARPNLSEVAAELQQFFSHWGLDGRMRRGEMPANLADAEVVLHDAEEARQSVLWGGTWRTVRIARGDCLMLQSPPKIDDAVREYQYAEDSKEYEAEIQLRIGRALIQSPDPEQQESGFHAYERGVVLSQFEPIVVDEYVAALEKLTNLERQASATRCVPIHKRTPAVVRLQATQSMAEGQWFDAWCEIAPALDRLPQDETLQCLGREIATHCDAVHLGQWISRWRDNPKLVRAVALALSVIGIPVNDHRNPRTGSSSSS